MNFQDDTLSIPIDNFKDRCVLVLDLTAMQDATESCPYPELVGEPLRLELNSTFPIEHVTELIVLRERMYSFAVEKSDVVGKISKNINIFLQESFKRIPLLNYRFRASFPSASGPTLNNDTFATMDTQPSNMQGERNKGCRATHNISE